VEGSPGHDGSMTTKSKHCSPGLDGRCRDESGPIRAKNENTQVGTLRKTYGPDFAAGVSDSVTLRALLTATGQPSLTKFRKTYG
jgi:hypothetical protein